MHTLLFGVDHVMLHQCPDTNILVQMLGLVVAYFMMLR